MDGRGELSSWYFGLCFGPSGFVEFSTLHQLCQLVSCLLIHPTDDSPSFPWTSLEGILPDSFLNSSCFGST